MRGVAVCVLSLSCLVPTLAAAQTTALYFDSQPGDYIGGGEQQTYDTGNALFSWQFSNGRLRVAVDNPEGAPLFWWTLSLSAPEGSLISPGVYEPAIQRPGAVPSLDFSGSGRGCNRTRGRFVVYEIEFDGFGTLTRFAADFEQHCEDATPALFGAIRLNSTYSSTVPFEGAYPEYSLTIQPAPNGYVTAPGIDCGAGRIDCSEAYLPDTTIALNATPSPGYVFLGWDAPGDCLGDEGISIRVSRRKSCTPVFAAAPGSGNLDSPDHAAGVLYLDRFRLDGSHVQMVYLPPLTPLSAPRASSSSVRFLIPDLETSWLELEFAAGAGEALTAGPYDYAASVWQWTGGQPLLWFSENACSGGRFLVHEIAFTGTTLDSFAADFELRCGSADLPMVGSIRYRSSRRLLQPFEGEYPSYGLRMVPTAGGYVSAGTLSCGDGQRDACDENFPSPTSVTLEAFTSPGFEFLGWAGACTGSDATLTVLVNSTLRCRAVFTPEKGSTAVADPALRRATLFIEEYGGASAPVRSLWVWPDTDVRTRQFDWEGIDPYFVFSDAAGRSREVRFGSPAERIVPGDYDEAYPSPNPLFPKFFLSSCDITRARFRVYEAEFNESGTPIRFAADFEAHCSNTASPYAAGAVRFNSMRLALLPFDGNYPIYRLTVVPPTNGHVTAAGLDCGAEGRMDCSETYPSATLVTLSAVPSPGYRFVAWGGACMGGTVAVLSVDWPLRCSVVFEPIAGGDREDDQRVNALLIDSSPGDRIGGGLKRVWTDAVVWSQSFSRNAVTLIVSQPNGRWWVFRFGAPGTEALGRQIYEGATEAWPRTGPYLSVSSPDSSTCNSSTAGRFIVHDITFASPSSHEVISFAADFVHRCSPASPALLGAIRFNSTRKVLTPFATAATRAFEPKDFSGDGSPDLVWRNSVTGRNAFWFMNGDTMGATPPFSEGADLVTDLNWEIRAVGDMDGDDRGDVIWQHAASGKLAAWLFVGATRVSTPLFLTLSGSPTEPDLDWKIVGAADMNADGNTDILWRHRVSGALRVWHMIGMEQWDSVDLPLVVADALWQVAGIADMDRDGWGDIVWRHYGTGRLAVWYMTDTLVLSTTVLPTMVSDTQWRLAGVADVNRDGHPDFVWQHLTGGKLAVWYMNGLDPVHYGMITPGVISDPNWRIAGVR